MNDPMSSAPTLRHVLLCLVEASDNDPAVARAAQLCRNSGAKLSVVIAVVDAAAPRGCCGVQGDRWRKLLDDETAERVRHAALELDHLCCRPEAVEIEVGPSVGDIVVAATDRLGCDRVVVSRRPRLWSGWGLSGRQLASLRRTGMPLDELNL